MKQTLKKFILTVPICLSLSGGSAMAQAAAPDEATLAKRAKAYGAFAHLPASTEAAVAIRDLNGMFDSVVKSNFFNRILELADEGGEASDDTIDQIREGLAKYAGDEIIIAYSEGTSAELNRLMSIYDIYVDTMYRAFGASLAGGDFGGMDEEKLMETVKKKLINPKSPLSKAIDEIQMPPMLIGSKMDAGTAGEIIGQIDDLEENLPPFVTVSTFDVEGSEFKSWAISLKDVFDENAQSEMEDALGDKELSDRLAKAIRGKRVEVSFGAIGDYFVVGLGRNHAHLEFVENPSESLVANANFAKLDKLVGKHLYGYAYAKGDLYNIEANMGLYRTMAESFVAGATEGGGPMMKKFGKNVKKLAAQMSKLYEGTYSDYVGVMYGENGLKGESHGGYMLNSINGKAKLKFANAGLDDAFMIAENVTNPKYDEAAIEMMGTLVDTIDTGIAVFGEMSGEDMDEFNEMKKLFGPKLEKIWGILSNKFMGGLGSDTAVIVDLNGTLPKIPGVPRVLVNKGKAPRIAIANTVKDRKKLSAAWDELVPAVNDLMEAIPGQEPGAEFQIPDTISSSKDGLDTHYFGMPFLSNDFMPSVSISDSLFFMSTSKKFSEGIAAKAAKSKGDLRGTYLRIDFDQLNNFAGSWVDLVLENKDVVFEGNEFAAEDFEEGAEIGKVVMDMARVLKSFEYNKYSDDKSDARSTWHLHLKDVK